MDFKVNMPRLKREEENDIVKYAHEQLANIVACQLSHNSYTYFDEAISGNVVWLGKLFRLMNQYER